MNTAISIKGPFWQAAATVIQIEKSGSPAYLAFRQLFIDHPALSPLGNPLVETPGSAVVICKVGKVSVTLQKPAAKTFEWILPDQTVTAQTDLVEAIRNGDLSLLLLRTVDEPDTYECLNGHILLPFSSVLLTHLHLESPVQPGRLLVHSSGLSVSARIAIRWAPAQSLGASFMLSALADGDYRLTLEKERLRPEERKDWIASWKALGAMIRPQGPQWMTLEIARPDDVPGVYWLLGQMDAPEKPVFFQPGNFFLYLSDRPLDGDGPEPTSVARFQPDQVRISEKNGQIILETGAEQAVSDIAEYQARPGATGEPWQETLQFSQLRLGYDATAVPRNLRIYQGLPDPFLPEGESAQPLVWGYQPLAEGWAELPFLNLTEQLYVDLGLETPEEEYNPRDGLNEALSGGFSLGNEERMRAQAQRPNETPWEVTMVNFSAAYGRWLLNPAPGTALPQILVRFFQPEVSLNGFLWLSADRPSREDALPDLDNWVNGLFPVNLISYRPKKTLFPPSTLFDMDMLQISAQVDPDSTLAQVSAWQFQYRLNQEFFDKAQSRLTNALDAVRVQAKSAKRGATGALRAQEVLLKEKLRQLPKTGLFEDQVVQVWLRHPSLPMVQALPMTQNLQPAQYPSANRQLAPFEMPFGADDTILALKMSASGMGDWPAVASPQRLRVAAGWRQNSDLPLASLSIPGLALEPVPGTNNALVHPFDELLVKYRFDLPYNDEQYALAQLPKTKGQSNTTTITPDVPLDRGSLIPHWEKLSNLAALAAADGVEALRKSAKNGMRLRNLVEPLEWPVTVQTEFDTYPGKLKLEVKSIGAPQMIELSTEKALRGISGTLPSPDPNKTSIKSASQNDSWTFTANAMASTATNLKLQESDTDTVPTLRDQRGVHRSPTKTKGLLMQTLVALEEANAVQAFDLTTLLQALPLQVSEGKQWQFWVKDLPVERETQRFERHRSAQNEDVNDPEAQSKLFNFKQGYEWRLHNETSESAGHLDLFNLHFYPLTLESLQVENQAVSAISLIGRLQLPLSDVRELEQVSNAVRLEFTRVGASLQLTSVALADHVIEWPLDASSGPIGETPRLIFSAIQLQGDRLVLPAAKVRFFLFDTEWTISMQEIVLNEPAPVTQTGILHTLGNNAGIGMEKLTLSLFETPNGVLLHRLVADVRLQLGARSRLALNCLLPFPLTGAGKGAPAPLNEADLFGDLQLVDPQVLHQESVLQIQWNQATGTQALHFLPGWPLARGPLRDTPGFATVQFVIEPPAANTSLPDMAIRSAFVESLLPCRWGDFLQDPLIFSGRETPDQRINIARERIFGASAGRLHIGITLDFNGDHWQESYLLNGYLEVRNLLSWPTTIALDNSTLRLDPTHSADHYRHSMRMLLNQHELPAELLTDQPSGELMFTFAKAKNWQFLAVTEHQILKISGLQPDPELAVEQECCRWTALQEQRWMAPRSFRVFLDYLSGKSTDAGELPELPAGEPPAVIPDPVVIEGRIINEVGRGVPGLRTELWQDESPLASFIDFKTTDAGGRFKFEVPQNKMRKKDSNGVFQFIKLHFLVSKGNKKIVTLKNPVGAWTVAELGHEFTMVINEDVPPIQMYGDSFNALLSEALVNTDDRLLVVEAGAHHWVRLESVPMSGPTTLQFLPDGAQTGVLASPSDYVANDQTQAKWQWLPMPFLGRFQMDDNHALGADPVLQFVAKTNDPSPLVQAFTSQTKTNLAVPISSIDLAAVNRWDRLDPNMLEESWFRLWNPKAESRPAFLPSVMSALPNTPARLSRAASMRQAFRGNRVQYPPVIDTAEAEAFGLLGVMQWRSGSLIRFDFASDPNKTLTPQQPFLLMALPLSALFHESGAHFVAATVLPVPDHTTMPQALAVSPYLSLGYQAADTDAEMPVAIISGELLCLDSSSKHMLPVASKLVEKPNAENDEADLREALLQWARDTHALLSPEAPAAVLRLREIRRTGATAADLAAVATTYAFRNVPLRPRPQITYRVFNLRTAVEQLRFREGQFGGFHLPELGRLFELSPPQVNGVQPLYLDDWDNTGVDPALAVNEWPWGLSGLRVSTRVTDAGRAAIGPAATDAKPVIRWWQGLQQFVQFRQETAGLPPLFRAKNIRSLLPVLPDIALPEMQPASDGKWQSILPGDLRLLVLGARTGVFNVLRHQLLTQTHAGGKDRTLVSGSVPVQHRIPRPVHLPANRPGREIYALQPWAGYLDALNNCHSSDNPVDAAFFADGKTAPNRLLTLRLGAPVRGEITTAWEGRIVLYMKSVVPAGSAYAPAWEVEPQLTVGESVFGFASATPTPAEQADAEPGAIALAFNVATPSSVRNTLALQSLGQVLIIKVFVKDGKDAILYRQTMQFPLRLSSTDLPRLPLEPRFVYFEDPEYNRLLASAAGNAQGPVRVGDKFYTLRLSTDRKVYNPDSSLFLRVDWMGEEPFPDGQTLPLPADYRLDLVVSRVSKDSGALEELDVKLLPQRFSPGVLLDFSLPKWITGNKAPFAEGEALQLVLRLRNKPPGEPDFNVQVGQIVLTLDIVLEPVIPVPPAAYGLLRHRNTGTVDCPRFAWSPAASRIEMVNPDDLLQEIVRRRAIFHWTDSIRPGQQIQYQVQKIAAGGSTHFPNFS